MPALCSMELTWRSPAALCLESRADSGAARILEAGLDCGRIPGHRRAEGGHCHHADWWQPASMV